MGGLLLALSNEKLRRFESLPLHRVFQVRNAYVHALVTKPRRHGRDTPPSSTSTSRASKGTSSGSGLSTLLCGEYHISEPERLVEQAMTEGLLDFTLDRELLGAAPPGRGVEPDAPDPRPGRPNAAKAPRQPRRFLLGTRIRPEPARSST